MKTRDEILNARSPGKCYMSWQTWQGDVKPILDSRIDSLPALITGFTSGRTLSAEPASPDLDLGIRWVGDLTDRLGSLSSPTGDTDLSQVATELALLEREMGTRPFNHSAVLDAARRVRRASDAARRGAAQTGDADDFLTRSRLARDAALATIRAGAPRQGSTLSAAPVNPSRAVREAFAATAKPGTPAALNAAAKAFWAGR